MTKKNRLGRLLGVAMLSLVAVVFGFTVTHAEVTPTMELTTSSSSWTVAPGTQFTMTARVLPANYRTVSRVEIRQGNTLLASCSSQNTCQFTVNSVVSGITMYQAVGYDIDGRVFASPVMSLTGNLPDQAGPVVSLVTSRTEVTTGANTGLYIEARATDSSVIRELRITRVDTGAYDISNCTNQTSDCTLRISLVFDNADVGRTFIYEAKATDIYANATVSSRVSVRVIARSNQLPGVYLERGTIPEQVGRDQSVSIRAEGWDHEGLNRVSIYANSRTSGYGYNGNNSSYTFRRDCTTTGHNLTCFLDINNFRGYEGHNFDVWAEVVDAAGQSVLSTTYSLRVSDVVVSPPIDPVNYQPGIYLNPNTIPAEVKVNQSVTIKAEAWDNEGLEKLTVYAINSENEVLIYNPNDPARNYQKTCYTSLKSLTCSLEISNFHGNEGRKLLVWALAVDAAGQTTKSPSYVMRVLPQPTPVVSPTVTTYINGNIAHLQENQAATIYGKASSPNGVWGVEVLALPSWTNEAITRRCILDKFSTTGSCDLTIGPFSGHGGHTVKVWTIAWDKQTGMGGSSDAQHIKITATPKPNNPPRVFISPVPSSKIVNSNQTVSWKVHAEDENGIDRIDFYVNARVVKTCSNVDTCHYTGGPFPAYAGTSVSYAAKVWDNTGKSTWTGYDYVTVNRPVARAAGLRVARFR